MNDPIRIFHGPRARLMLAIGLLLGAQTGFSQSTTAGSQPEMPPLPPNFTPPPPPPNFIPRFGPAQPAQPAQPQPTQSELLQRPTTLVNTGDPRMQEQVGLIRIPEMGTNEVLEMLENFTGKPILRQQTLPTVKITFFSQEALSRGEAITAIESLLALNGIAITNLGEQFLKAVPSAIINSQVPRPWEGTTLDAIPSQVIYEKIFELDFLTVEEAVTLLQPLMSSGTPIGFSKSNLILITDALVNLQRIERLLPVLDKPGKLRTEILFFELQNLKSTEVVRRLQQLTSGVLKNRLDGNTSFEADERTNQLLVFTHPANVDLVTELVGKLDLDVAPATATNVYSIRYADATEVVAIIDQIVTGQRQVRTETGGDNSPAAQAARARQAAQVRQNNQTAATARSESNNLQFSDFLTIVADERANTIVASGTHSDLLYLEQLISQIDTLLAQVRIEVVITDVSLTEAQQRGIDEFGFSYTGAGFDVDFESPGNTWTASPGSFYGLSSGFGWQDGNFSMDVVLSRIAENDNIKVLSAPTIVTTHNKEATVSVGQEVPVITQITSSDVGTGSVTSGTGFVDRTQVQYRDVKLELKVTPLIGSDGIVQMEIDQQVQDLGTPVIVGTNQPAQPTINNRSATSYVSVMDGGLIALGGLQRLSTENTRGKMAILGSIPLLGNLFKSNDKTINRTELLIFIRPTIIRTTDDADRDANSLIDALEDDEQIRDYLQKGSFRDSED